MPLTSSTVSASIAYSLSKAVSGYSTVKISDSKAYSISPSVSTFTNLITQRYSIAASGTQVIDVFGSFTNLLGESLSGLTKICGILLIPTGTDAVCKLERGASDPLQWFFVQEDGISIPTGGVFLYAQPTAATVSNTVKNLLITNTGTGTLTLDVVLLVGT